MLLLHLCVCCSYSASWPGICHCARVQCAHRCRHSYRPLLVFLLFPEKDANWNGWFRVLLSNDFDQIEILKQQDESCLSQNQRLRPTSEPTKTKSVSRRCWTSVVVKQVRGDGSSPNKQWLTTDKKVLSVGFCENSVVCHRAWHSITMAAKTQTKNQGFAVGFRRWLLNILN